MGLTTRLLMILPMWALLATTAFAGERWLTTTLLPVVQKEGGRIDIEQSGTPVRLEFDLSALPRQLHPDDFGAVVLRLVASDPAGHPLPTVTGRAPGVAKNVVVLEASDKGSPRAMISGNSTHLAKAVADSYLHLNKEKTFALELRTTTARGRASLYSGASYGDSYSNIPRLVVTYKQNSPKLLDSLDWGQKQRDAEHTGRTGWASSSLASGYDLIAVDVPDLQGIENYPLLYKGNLHVIGKCAGEGCPRNDAGTKGNLLVILDFKGRMLRKRTLGMGDVVTPPVISRTGMLYLWTSAGLAGYDLDHPEREPVAFSSAVEKVVPGGELTVADDGSVYAVIREGDQRYLLGLTKDLKPFLKSDLGGDAANAVTSVVAVGGGGGEVGVDTSAAPVIIDIRNPSSQRRLDPAGGGKRFHAPVAAPDGYFAFARHSDEGGGLVSVYHGLTKKPLATAACQQPGACAPVSQPVLSGDGYLAFLQNGRLRTHSYTKHASFDASSGTLSTTSNLVMDGGDHVYFWDSGKLFGCTVPQASCDELKRNPGNQSIDGLGKNQRLLLAPDGTIWANNQDGRRLYALRPTYGSADMKPTQLDELKSATVYRTSGVLAIGAQKVGDAPATRDARILLQADKGISFARGFAVKQGSSLLCRTGF